MKILSSVSLIIKNILLHHTRTSFIFLKRKLPGIYGVNYFLYMCINRKCIELMKCKQTDTIGNLASDT